MKNLITLILPMALCATGHAQNFSFSSTTLAVGQSHVCWHVVFALGQGELLKAPQPDLDSLYLFLAAKPTVRIEIGQHTETRGVPEANLTLSQKRADAVKSYLVNKGVDAARLSSKGYGQTRPYLTKEQEMERRRTAHPPEFPRNSRTTITITGT